MATTAPTIDEELERAAARLSAPRALLAMTRPSHIILILAIFSNGVLLALWRDPSTATAATAAMVIWPAAILLILAAAAVHLANEAADHETDRLTRRTPFSGGSGALAASGLSPRVPLAFGLGLAIGSAALTLATVVLGALPPAAAVMLLGGLGGGLAYSLPPLALARRGWGEPLNALLGAALLPLFGVAMIAATVTALDVIAFLPLLAVTFASVLATAWPDRLADGVTGKATLQVRLTPRRLRWMALATFISFVVATWLSAAVGAMPLAMAGLLIAPLSIVGLLRYTRDESPLANVAAMVALVVITMVGLLASLISEVGHR